MHRDICGQGARLLAPSGGRVKPMRIALTHNLQTSPGEAEAEFDSPETIAFLRDMLERLGHEVDLVEVSRPVARVVELLEVLRPDLIFNTAEGRRGRLREAFFPALFDELGLPHTGSDAYVCAVTLDKQLTKRIVRDRGVPTPDWQFVDRIDAALDVQLPCPVIVKPNFEGSSKGIGHDSVVTEPARLRERVETALECYPDGVLVERYVPGRDVTVPFLERAVPDRGGVLPPAEYTSRSDLPGPVGFQIYDFDLKSSLAHLVEVRVPATLDPGQLRTLYGHTRTVVQALGIRDVARLDFRLHDDGTLYFLEVNALPSFEPGASLYASAAAAGLRDPETVLQAIIESALARRGLAHPTRSRRRRQGRRRPRVGLIYNLKRVAPTADGEDSDAEYDSPATISAIAAAIEELDGQVVALEATRALVDELPRAGIDVAFNVAEGISGRSREAQVPALLELLQIPYTGSDPCVLALTLDKVLAKRVVGQGGVPTAAFAVMQRPPTRMPPGLTFPVVVKPVAEGSSKGITRASVAKDMDELRARVAELVTRYAQPALVEEYLPGREFTVGLLGSTLKPTVLPPMEIVFTDPAVSHPVYSYQHKIESDRSVRYDTRAAISGALRAEMLSLARRAFATLGCRDVARMDFRLDAAGRVVFIECNPLPGLTPGYSDLCLIASASGLSYTDLIGRILAPAMRRAGHRFPTRRGLKEEQRGAESAPA